MPVRMPNLNQEVNLEHYLVAMLRTVEREMDVLCCCEIATQFDAIRHGGKHFRVQ